MSLIVLYLSTQSDVYGLITIQYITICLFYDTFDLHLWPSAFVKVTCTLIIRCSLCSNLILIRFTYKSAKRELWKKWILIHCDLDLWPKVTNFHRVRASFVSNNLAKTVSKSVHPFGWNFVHKKSGHTDRHTHRQTGVKI